MALVISDRVKETTITTGTGTLTLGGAVTGFETFTANLSDGDTTYYACTDNTDFEVGLGTFTASGTTLARTTILASSNSGSAVNWAAGTRTIFCTLPAAKTVFLDGSNVANISNLKLASGATVTAILDEDGLSSDSATSLATQQSIKAYVDAQVTGQDLDFQGDTGGALSIDLDSEVLDIAGGTGIDTSGSANTLTVAIDSTVTTLTGTQTLTNKTLTTPIIGSISNTGTLTLPTSTDTLVGRATTDTLTNKSIDASQLTGTVANARLDAQLQDVAGLAVTDGNFIVGDGANFVAESGATARTSLGLGTAATTDTGISNGNTLVADSTVADDDFLRINGTSVEGRSASEVLSDIGAIDGSSLNADNLSSGTVPNARLDAQLQDVAGLAVTNGNFIVGDGANFVAESGATARTSLGLGTAAVTDTGISNGNTLVADSTVADNDFLRINGTSVEGRSASEVLSDIGATTATAAADEATALAIALG